MAKKRQNVSKDESKRDKFKRIVEPRVCKAIKAIGLIGNCSSSGYEYTPDDIACIFGAIDRAEQQVRNRFETQGKARAEFNLA